MAHTLVETPSFPTGATVTVPDPGDARTAASILPAFQELANRTRALYEGTGASLWTAASDLEVLGITHLNGLYCHNATVFEAPVEMPGQLVDMAGCTVSGNVTYSGFIRITNNLETVGGNITATGGQVSGTSAQFGSCSAGALTASTGAFTDRVSFTLNGRVTHRTIVPSFTGSPPSATVDCRQYRHIYIPNGSFSADATLVLSGTPADGEELHITSDETNFCEIYYSASPISGATVGTTPGTLPRTVKLVFFGLAGVWRVMQQIPYL